MTLGCILLLKEVEWLQVKNYKLEEGQLDLSYMLFSHLVSTSTSVVVEFNF